VQLETRDVNSVSFDGLVFGSRNWFSVLLAFIEIYISSQVKFYNIWFLCLL